MRRIKVTELKPSPACHPDAASPRLRRPVSPAELQDRVTA